MRRWMRAAMGLLMGAMVMGTAFSASVKTQAAMLDMNRFNSGGRYTLIVDKVPVGTAGRTMNLKFKIRGTNKNDDEKQKIAIALVSQENNTDIYQDLDSAYKDTPPDPTDETSESKGSSNLHTFPFEVDSSTFKPTVITGVSGKTTRTVSMNLKLRRDLQAGYYQVFFIYDEDGNVDNLDEVSDMNGEHLGMNIYVKAADDKDSTEETDNTDYRFSIGDDQSTVAGSYGQVVDFGVNLTNKGYKKAYQVRVEMQVDGDKAKFPFDINDGNYTRYMGDMEPGQMVTMPYSMAFRSDVDSGFFPIHYFVYHKETEDGQFKGPVDLIYYVKATGKDSTTLGNDAGVNDRTKARIVVESYTTEPEEVYAGKPFTLHVRLKNSSSNVPASNCLFTFVPEEVNNTPVFTADTGSTSLVVNSLTPGASSDLSLNFVPQAAAEQRAYKITIKVDYDSPEFKNANSELTVAVPVKQEARFSTSTVEVTPDTIAVGEETNVTFGVNNTSKVLLYNVTARFEGDSITPVESYVGNVKPGETGNVDAMITGAAVTEDSNKVKIVISYEDENGKVTETEKEMTLNVTEQQTEPDIMPQDMEPETNSKKGSMAIPVGAAVLAAGAFGVHKFRKRKKMRDALKEDDGDNDIS